MSARCDGGDRERRTSSEREARRRGECRLSRARTIKRYDSELVPRMRAEGIMSHQLRGDLCGQHLIEATINVDSCELAVLCSRMSVDLGTLQREVSTFDVSLRMHGHILTGRHRHGSGDETRNACNHDARVRAVRRRQGEHDSRHRQNAVIGAKYRGT